MRLDPSSSLRRRPSDPTTDFVMQGDVWCPGDRTGPTYTVNIGTSARRMGDASTPTATPLSSLRVTRDPGPCGYLSGDGGQTLVGTRAVTSSVTSEDATTPSRGPKTFFVS